MSEQNSFLAMHPAVSAYDQALIAKYLGFDDLVVANVGSTTTMPKIDSAYRVIVMYGLVVVMVICLT